MFHEKIITRKLLDENQLNLVQKDAIPRSKRLNFNNILFLRERQEEKGK